MIVLIMQKRIIKNQRNENIIDIEEPQLPASTSTAQVFGEGIIQHPQSNHLPNGIHVQSMSAEGINGITQGMENENPDDNVYIATEIELQNQKQIQNNNNHEIISENFGIAVPEQNNNTNDIINDIISPGMENENMDDNIYIATEIELQNAKKQQKQAHLSSNINDKTNFAAILAAQNSNINLIKNDLYNEMAFEQECNKTETKGAHPNHSSVNYQIRAVKDVSYYIDTDQ